MFQKWLAEKQDSRDCIHHHVWAAYQFAYMKLKPFLPTWDTRLLCRQWHELQPGAFFSKLSCLHYSSLWIDTFVPFQWASCLWRVQNSILEPYHGLLGRDLRDYFVSLLAPQWAGMLPTRPGCSKPCSTWPWTLPGVGQLQLLWSACARASPHLRWRSFSWYPDNTYSLSVQSLLS